MFLCRGTRINVAYTTKASDTAPTKAPVAQPKPQETTDSVNAGVKAPPLDEVKVILMKVLSECYYFKKIEEDSPIQFASLRDKLKYFHPAFHSMTPEGLNARLTFLNQCVRPGDTLPLKGLSDVSDLNARNTTFGPAANMRVENW